MHEKLYAFSYFQLLYRRDAEAQSMSPSRVSSVIFFPAMNANFNKILFCMDIIFLVVKFFSSAIYNLVFHAWLTFLRWNGSISTR